MHLNKALAFAAAVAAPAVAAPDVNVYFGQSGTDGLASYCDSKGFEYVTIGFVSASPESDPLTNYPTTNFAAHCAADVYEVNGHKSRLLSSCTFIREDIKYCQSKGKKVLLSVGGVWSSAPANRYNVSSVANGQYFGNFLWKAFGPYDPAWTGPRPFDISPSEHVVLDGFDIDIEVDFKNAPGGYTGYIKLIQVLRAFITSSGTGQIITGAPQCPLNSPYNYMNGIISVVKFDKLFIQFYNNPSCQGNAPGFNYNAWTQFLQGTASQSAKLYIGLPGDNTISGYLPLQQAKNLINQYKNKPNFGGISIWDVNTGKGNKNGGKTYYENLHNHLIPVPPQSSTAYPTTTTSSSSSSSSTSVVYPTTTSSSVAYPTTTSSSETSSEYQTSTTSDAPVDTSTSSDYPVDTSTSSDYPVDTSTSSDYPAGTTTSSDIPVDTSTSSDYPVDTSTAYPTSTTSDYPVDTSTTSDYPVDTSTSSDYPVDTSTSSDYPVDTSTSSDYPVDTSTSSDYPIDTSTAYPTATSSDYPVDTSTSSDYPVDTSTSSDYPVETSTAYPTTSEYPVDTSTAYPTSTDEPITTGTYTPYPTNTDDPIYTDDPTYTDPYPTYTPYPTGTDDPINTDGPTYSYPTYSPYPTGTDDPIYTTSTVYSTSCYTREDGVTTTEYIPVYTTVCPVSTAAPIATAYPVYTTSTIYETHTYTVTAGPHAVPYVTTEYIPVGTTVCPVESPYFSTVTVPKGGKPAGGVKVDFPTLKSVYPTASASPKTYPTAAAAVEDKKPKTVVTAGAARHAAAAVLPAAVAVAAALLF